MFFASFVLLLHLSPLCLIWLAVVCFFAGRPVMLIGPIQEASMGFVVLLAMTGKPSENEENSEPQKNADQNVQEMLENQSNRTVENRAKTPRTL